MPATRQLIHWKWCGFPAAMSLLPCAATLRKRRAHFGPIVGVARLACGLPPPPVVLNRFPGKRTDKTVENIVHSMCTHIGVPPPVKFAFQAESFGLAIPHARHFLTRRPHWRP